MQPRVHQKERLKVLVELFNAREVTGDKSITGTDPSVVIHLTMPRCLNASSAVRFDSPLVDPFAAWTARPLKSEERYRV